MLFGCIVESKIKVKPFDKIISCQAVRCLSLTNHIYVLKRDLLSRFNMIGYLPAK